jgi:hypothetical protein
MNVKRTTSKLALNRESLRELTATDLKLVVGGKPVDHRPTDHRGIGTHHGPGTGTHTNTK